MFIGNQQMVKASNMERSIKLLYLHQTSDLITGFYIVTFHLLDAFRLDEGKIDFFRGCNALNILIYTTKLEIKNSQLITIKMVHSLT